MAHAVGQAFLIGIGFVFTTTDLVFAINHTNELNSGLLPKNNCDGDDTLSEQLKTESRLKWDNRWGLIVIMIEYNRSFPGFGIEWHGMLERERKEDIWKWKFRSSACSQHKHVRYTRLEHARERGKKWKREHVGVNLMGHFTARTYSRSSYIKETTHFRKPPRSSIPLLSVCFCSVWKNCLSVCELWIGYVAFSFRKVCPHRAHKWNT